MTSRVLVYAKATEDFQTTQWLTQYLLMPIVAASKSMPTAQKPVIKVVCALNSATLRYHKGNEDYVNLPLAHNPAFFDVSTLGSIDELSTDSAKSSQFTFQELGTEKALTQFLSDATNGTPLNENDILILWGHGSASGALSVPIPELEAIAGRGLFSSRIATKADSTTAFEQDNHLQPREIANALKSGNHKPGLVLMNSCQGGTIELAHALMGCAKYLLASPTTVMPLDWDLQTWLPPVFNNSPFDAKKAGHAFVALSRTKKQYPNTYVALIDLDQMPTLKASVLAFVQATLTLNAVERQAVLDARSSASSFDIKKTSVSTVDLKQFVENVKAVGLLRNECDAVLGAIGKLVIDSDETKLPGVGGVSVVFPRSSLQPIGGAGFLYIPPTLADRVFSTFVYETDWHPMLKHLSNKGLPVNRR